MMYLFFFVFIILILIYLVSKMVTPIYDELILNLNEVSKIINNQVIVDNGIKVNKIRTELTKPKKIIFSGVISKLDFDVNTINLFPEFKEMLKLLEKDYDLFVEKWNNEYGLYQKVQNNTITFYNKYGIRCKKREFKKNLFYFFGMPTTFTDTVYYTNSSKKKYELDFLFPDNNCEECSKIKLKDTLGIWGKFNLLNCPSHFNLGCEKCELKQKIKFIYNKKNHLLSGSFKEYYEGFRKNRNHGVLKTKKFYSENKKIGKCSMYYQNKTEALSISFFENKMIGPGSDKASTFVNKYQKFKDSGEVEFEIFVTNSGILTQESKCFCECNSKIKNCKTAKKSELNIPSKEIIENDIFLNELLFDDLNINGKTIFFRN